MLTDRNQIESLVEHYLAAYEGHDAKSCTAVYTSDARVLSPWGPPANGHTAIEAAHLAWFEDGETNKQMHIEDLIIVGDLAICLIRFEADIPGTEGDTQRFHGASLNALRRQTGGSWKISHTSLNELHDTCAASAG